SRRGCRHLRGARLLALADAGHRGESRGGGGNDLPLLRGKGRSPAYRISREGDGVLRSRRRAAPTTRDLCGPAAPFRRAPVRRHRGTTGPRDRAAPRIKAIYTLLWRGRERGPP